MIISSLSKGLDTTLDSFTIVRKRLTLTIDCSLQAYVYIVQPLTTRQQSQTSVLYFITFYSFFSFFLKLRLIISSVFYNFLFLFMLFMISSLNLALKEHQIDAFNFKKCAKYSSGRAYCPQAHPRGSRSTHHSLTKSCGKHCCGSPSNTSGAIQAALPLLLVM